MPHAGATRARTPTGADFAVFPEPFVADEHTRFGVERCTCTSRERTGGLRRCSDGRQRGASYPTPLASHSALDTRDAHDEQHVAFTTARHASRRAHGWPWLRTSSARRGGSEPVAGRAPEGLAAASSTARLCVQCARRACACTPFCVQRGALLRGPAVLTVRLLCFNPPDGTNYRGSRQYGDRPRLLRPGRGATPARRECDQRWPLPCMLQPGDIDTPRTTWPATSSDTACATAHHGQGGPNNIRA